MSFGYELISETDRLQEFPEMGRIVPEYRNDCIREILFRPLAVYECCSTCFANAVNMR
jgi:plasmid stabilization system protein ParE